MSKYIKQAIVLAGGLGARLRSVVTDVPKPMADIRGRPFLEWLLDYWIEQGIEEFILAVGYKAELIQKHLGNQYKTAKINYSIETEPLGTGGAVLKAISMLDDPEFLLLNGDTFYTVNLNQLTRLHREKSSKLTVALHKVAQNDRYTSVLLNEQQQVLSLKHATCEKFAFINAGVYIINKFFLESAEIQQQACSLENDILPALIGQGMYGFITEGDFVDIGVPESYQAAQNIVT